MKFRTEIQIQRGRFEINHDDRILLLGSCFSENVGSRMLQDGFAVTYNPMGPLYNPVSLGRLVSYMLNDKKYNETDLIADEKGVWHCLDFASRYQNVDSGTLVENLNADFASLKDAFINSSVLIFTFGSSVVYSQSDFATDAVGNCHKFPAANFSRLSISAQEISAIWRPIIENLITLGKRVILTVSPIRHLADGLHGNQLSKARLLLACDNLKEYADYFPSYEILLDDLRDYRFYAADMKHPSEQACDYIYELFGNTYYNNKTKEMAGLCRDRYLRESHRKIL